MYFPPPRGKRYFFCETKVVEIKKRFPLGRSFLFFVAPTKEEMHRGKRLFEKVITNKIKKKQLAFNLNEFN